MQKVYVSKNTNEVMQLIQEEYENFEAYTESTFGEECYLVVLEAGNHINGHNYRYNIETESFEIIEDYEEINTEVEDKDDAQKLIKELKEENKNLNNKLDLILQQQLEIQNYMIRVLGGVERRTVNER